MSQSRFYAFTSSGLGVNEATKVYDLLPHRTLDLLFSVVVVLMFSEPDKNTDKALNKLNIF